MKGFLKVSAILLVLLGFFVGGEVRWSCLVPLELFFSCCIYWQACPAQPGQPRPAGESLAGLLVGPLGGEGGWLAGWLVGWLAGRPLAQQTPRTFPLTFNEDLIKKREGIGPGNSRSISIDF